MGFDAAGAALAQLWRRRVPWAEIAQNLPGCLVHLAKEEAGAQEQKRRTFTP